MNLPSYVYLRLPELSGNIVQDIKSLLVSNGKEDTYAHILSVSSICGGIADSFGLDRDKCVLSGLLHDISAVVKPEDMLSWVRDNALPLDEAELKYPFLLHQRISAVIARDRFGVSDPDILSAVDCHTTLKAEPSRYDMALFVADKLSWDQEGTPLFYGAVKAGLEVSLERASLAYIDHMMDGGRVLYPHRRWLEARAWLRQMSS